MAEGIADGTNGKNSLDGNADYSTATMFYHSFETSAKWFQKDAWLDVNMWGSCHAEINNTRAFEAALADWNLPNPKPTLNGESNYVGHGINYAIEDNGAFTLNRCANGCLLKGVCGFGSKHNLFNRRRVKDCSVIILQSLNNSLPPYHNARLALLRTLFTILVASCSSTFK